MLVEFRFLHNVSATFVIIRLSSEREFMCIRRKASLTMTSTIKAKISWFAINRMLSEVHTGMKPFLGAYFAEMEGITKGG